MSSVKKMDGIMRDYFRTCVKQMRGEAVDANGRPLPKPKKTIVSPAGLCVKLGISKTELYAMQHGTPEEQKFFEDMQLEYEIAVDAMAAASMFDATTYGKIKASFRSTGVEADNNVTVVFENWYAPDDWEDYQDLKRIGIENSLSFRQLKMLLEKTIKAGL